jgi:hypothetical protein
LRAGEAIPKPFTLSAVPVGVLLSITLPGTIAVQLGAIRIYRAFLLVSSMACLNALN